MLSASGRRVPNVSVALTVTGADAPARLNTGADGVATVPLTARDAVTLTAKAELPADLPALYVPTQGESARNAQRIVAPSTSTPSAEAKAAVRVQPQLSTQISAQSTVPGAQITDTVKVTGLGNRSATIQAALYGPYPAREAITCQDAPVWTGTVEATGDGEYVTAPVTLTQPGYYTYREWIVESDRRRGGGDGLRGGRRDDGRARAARDHDPDQRAGDRSGRADHRFRGRQRPRQAERDGQRRAVGPVRHRATRSAAKARRSGPARCP